MPSYNPHIKVEIQTILSNGESGEKIDISSWVVSMNTNKAYGRAHGIFLIRVPYAATYKDKRANELFAPNDIVYVSIDKGDGKGLKMVKTGSIDRVARVMAYDDGGNPQRFADIHGSGLGKILLRHNCGWDIAFKKNLMGSTEALREAEFLTFFGTPAELAEKIVTNFLLKQLPFWQKRDLVKKSFTTDDDWHTIDTTLKMKNGPIWAALKNIANEPWNTLTTETNTGKLDIVLQRTPFDISAGNRGRLTIPVYLIKKGEIIRQDVGVADNERTNYLRMFLPEASQKSEGVIKITYLVGDVNVFYDEESVGRHGYHELEIKTNYSPYNFSEEVGPPPPPNIANRGAQDYMQSRIRERASALWEWHRYDHEMESGTIVVHGDPEVICGSGILDQETGYEYFVEQVSHEYRADGPKCTTSLGVVRGQPHVRR
jgi:hypothetical protein